MIRYVRLFAVASCLLAACEAHDHEADAPNLTVTISGEGGALSGFAFPSSSPNDLAFVDGWDLRFERILVTVDSITLSSDPDQNPTDQAQTGAVVARAAGPWAVDMSRPGAVTGITPQSGGKHGTLFPLGAGHDHSDELLGKNPAAQSLFRFESLEGSRSFDPTARYAFGFDIVAASASALRTNLDAASNADYNEMVAQGLSVLYVGTARFRGTQCTSSDPSYDFSKLPSEVRFRFGFKTPAAYKNCQNTDLRGKAFDGEEAQRGVQVSEPTVAQITLHVDHPFWNTVDHDATELYFDQMAALAKDDGTLTMDDLSAADFTSFRDKHGQKLPWRSCIADKPVRSGTRQFDPGSVQVDPAGDPSRALRNYADFVAYQQSTQGHLNADGLCAVERRFASPR